MDWTPFLVTFAVLLLACWVIPAAIELAWFRIKCWRVRREGERIWERQYRAPSDPRTDHLLSSYRHDTRVRPGARLRALSLVSARKRGVGDHGPDAA